MMAELNKTNLIVNYLPQQFTDKEFHELFSKPGQLTASKIIRDRATGYSYGFGFVDYETEEDAANAISMLNGYKIQNKIIKVSYSRMGDNVKGANLYIRNLPKTITEATLEHIFSPYGNIVQTRVLLDGSGTPKGIGFVLYSTKEQAEVAMQALDNKVPVGFHQPLSVKFAEDNKFKMQASTTAAGLTSGLFVNPALPGSGSGPVPFGGQNFAGTLNGGGPMRNQVRLSRFNPITGAVNNPAFNGSPVPGMPQQQGIVLFVYNIGTDTDEYALWQLFSPFGVVRKVNIMRDSAKNQGKGYGFVTMVNYEEAVYAIQQLNGFNFSGRPLQVSFKQ